MDNVEQPINKTEEERIKIRQRYKGISIDELHVIPAKPKIDFFKDDSEKKVAVYARVSTDSLEQESSYELQRNHYNDTIERHPGWKLVEIYSDKGISGTSLRHREGFNRMIEDCLGGKIDLIVTKSVSRFARNLLDCVGVIRMLADLPSPVEVFFETEGIHTLSRECEMILSFMATLAQQESQNKSEIMNSSIEMRFSRGIFLTPKLLGYDLDMDGNLVINEDEAKTVKLIFFMYLYGYSLKQISEILTSLGRTTKLGNTVWSTSSILQILQNERHCGDVLAHKTWTPNYLDHKSKKNVFNCTQYLQKGHHEAIISREDFNAVQKIIRSAKYGHKGFLPEIEVVNSGAFKGYIKINPRWAGFKKEDYFNAINATTDTLNIIPKEATASTGEFDLRGFQIARSQFFTDIDRIVVTFTDKYIKFNTVSVNKLDSIYINLLINPITSTFAIKACDKKDKNSVQWAKKANGKYQPKPINGAAFLPTLFDIFNWNTDNKYKMTGVKHQNEDGTVIVFNLEDTEIYLPTDTLNDSENLEELKDMQPLISGKALVAYPANWAEGFGTHYYEQTYSHEATTFDNSKGWNLSSESKTFQPDPDANAVTSKKEVYTSIKTIINDMKQEAINTNGQSKT